MNKYALIKNGVKIGEQQSSEPVNHPSLILIDGAIPRNGAVFDVGSGVFSESANENEVIRNIKPDAMRDRFSFGERVAIKSSANMQVQTFYDDLSLRKKKVNLDSDRFDLAFALLKSENLLIAENGETIDERILRLKADGTQDEVI